MMKKVIFLLGTFSFLVSAPVGAVEFPELTEDIYIQDIADVLTPAEEEELRRLGTELEDATTAQLAVMAVPSLEGKPIADYALEALRHYGIGKKEENNGALMVISTGDREIYISTGYGLEAVLPDGEVGRILDSYAIPYLKQDEYGKGIMNTYKALYKEVAAAYDWNNTSLAAQPAVQQSSVPDEKDDWLIPRGIIVAGIVIWIVISLFGDGAGRGNSKNSGRRSSSSSRRSSSGSSRSSGGGSRSGRGGSGGGGGAGRKF
ncbi:TPM domain-containing protein [Planococcus shenhongbingii]|uniref:TPM domain-containing protein n=1 Tax=Planococcus shenhongbingii TaxID=3058398 RepID=UPI00260EF1F8|nr:TPM domain-containing protein [Planococcus sp. N016]WKA59700.1 TPM domain-containing protein [Planococcus sp. N016]